MIKLLIFDLDNTLFDTHGQLGVRVLDRMVECLREAGMTPEQEKVLREQYSFTGFRIIARQLGFSPEMKRIGMDVYKTMELSHITPFDDVKLLKDWPQRKVLVTTGTKEVQLNKVEILKIKDLFEEVIVDESSTHENKQRIFSELMGKHGLKPEEVMVIGDNPESEMLAGRNLKMATVQVMRRAFIRGEADYHIKSFSELDRLLRGGK